MSISAYDAFSTMFYALDAAYSDLGGAVLRSYLTNANPFLFAGEGSADPAVFELFKQEFDSRIGDSASPEEARLFVRDYLGNEGEVLLAAFDAVADSERWESAISGL